MSDLDRLRRDAAAFGFVLLPQSQAESIGYHVRGIYNERMAEHERDMRDVATALREGQEVAMFASGEGGARAADQLADTFKRQQEEMDSIALACERTILTTTDRTLYVTYDEDGYTVQDDEYNETWNESSEDKATQRFTELLKGREVAR
jgi:hypothetical protein